MDRPDDDGANLQAEREKWDAWYAQRHLSRTEAKRQYITTLLDTMNKYASSSPEARELISELEFVWDQIKSNSPSSSPTSPVHSSNLPLHQSSRIPHSRSNYGSQYGNIRGRISRVEAEELGSRVHGRDPRLRVLTPVSQPDVYMPSTGRNYETATGEEEEEEEEDDDDDEEDFQEARNSPYEDYGNDQQQADNSDARRRPPGALEKEKTKDRTKDRDKGLYNRRWRRRIEQAMTKMTAEVAAMREQMETRALNSRRRSSLWAWIKWLVWIAIRQLCWDIAVLGCVLLWLHVVNGDKQLEDKLRGLSIWTEVRRRVAAVRFVRVRIPRLG
ncbi:uncharacterized protein PADG_02923 [Paracoccidioides brasiliensis Pb18]|uniref:ACB domain-containing protein n=1 Tax=Paracoccidioides brasiliensis (strain Pb18) TaxID=502780 RepID=C1G6W8_PARBD|nr:uncharacterized protein PADG_02923 [Paracoccidioides brasiliensis Pb18]EEH46825.2 hypothetical protein PADG_02923 [Paracoccidioides brasiliensis Pb18]